jgi:hypothetical protein
VQGGGLVTPLLTYADHHAGTSEAALQLREALQRNGKLASMYEATGAPIHTGYAPPQLLRLAKEQPVRRTGRDDGREREWGEMDGEVDEGRVCVVYGGGIGQCEGTLLKGEVSQSPGQRSHTRSG